MWALCTLSLPAQVRKFPRPLAAPAYQLPTSHGAIAEAMLGHLNHPWPLGQCPTATRARPGLVVGGSGSHKVQRVGPEVFTSFGVNAEGVIDGLGPKTHRI